jgi:hypothetical protein
MHNVGIGSAGWGNAIVWMTSKPFRHLRATSVSGAQNNAVDETIDETIAIADLRYSNNSFSTSGTSGGFESSGSSQTSRHNHSEKTRSCDGFNISQAVFEDCREDLDEVARPPHLSSLSSPSLLYETNESARPGLYPQTSASSSSSTWPNEQRPGSTTDSHSSSDFGFEFGSDEEEVERVGSL